MVLSSGSPCRLGLFLAAFALCAVARADDATGVPRYKLRLGQEISYHSSSTFKYDGGMHGSKVDWRAWVVRENGDGWRVVIRETQRFLSSSGGRNSNEGPARVALAYFDLRPDGRITSNETLGFQLDPSGIFPRLPADAQEMREGWEGNAVQPDARTSYRPDPKGSDDQDTWSFDGTRRGRMDEIYLSTSRGTYTFDRKKGLITRVATENTQGYGFKGKGTGTTELEAVETHDAGWTKAFAEASERYFAANKAYDELAAKASRDPERVDDLLSQAEAGLKKAREEIDEPILRDRIDEQLKAHKSTSSYYSEEAKNRAEVVGHEAAEWKTGDLDGKKHALKDYRGKVVILDFWYRGCGWCIRAMPQLKQLADDFKGEPVAVLGMNTDRDEDDAKFVVEKMALNYPSLKAEGLPEKYHVRGFPTLIIIDQDGKVSDVHVGYSANLRDEVSKTVKGLLSRK